MPIFITPGQFVSRASLYQQLAQLTAAGLTLQSAIELQHRNPPGRFLRKPLDIILTELRRGATFADALRCASQWVPAFDIALIDAGEQSGRLPDCFHLLANHYETTARLVRQMISSLLYPALLLHLAVVLLPLPQLVLTMNVGHFLKSVLGVLLPIYAIVMGCSWALNADRQGKGAALLEAIIHRIPVLGQARRSLAVARLSSALEGLIAAGMPILQAWELAAATCSSPALQGAVARWKPLFESGVTPAEALRDSPEFPEVFVKLYETAEITGSLDDAMRRCRTYFQEEGTRRMEALATWTPRIIYLVLVFAVAYQIIQAWTGHYNAIVDMPF